MKKSFLILGVLASICATDAYARKDKNRGTNNQTNVEDTSIPTIAREEAFTFKAENPERDCPSNCERDYAKTDSYCRGLEKNEPCCVRYLPNGTVQQCFTQVTSTHPVGFIYAE